MNRRPHSASLSLAAKEALQSLQAMDDVTSMHAGAGQVLVYHGHIAPGVFLVLSGVVALEHGPPAKPTKVIKRDASQGPFIVPSPTELEQETPALIRVEQAGDLLFIPRSLLLDSEQIRDTLLRSKLPYVSMV